MKTLVLTCSFFILLLTSFNCKSPTAPGGKGISISVADVSCTEVWLNLSANNVTLPANIIIKKNGNNFLNLNLTTKDTTLYDSTLLPSQTYTYQAQYNKGFAFERSEVVTAKTLDTTSSNFSWQLFTLGNYLTGNSSILYDVAIINDTSAWAVGEIYTDDSTGMYNAVHWNGKKWQTNKITVNFRGNNIIPILDGIYALSENQIWLVGGLAIYGDGKVWTPFDVRKISGFDSLSFTKCWGQFPNNMYFIGRNGSVAHYLNNNWQRIESGTGYNLYDIYSNDGKTIYAGGGDYRNYSGVLLEGQNGNWQILNEGKDVNANQIFHPYFVGVAATVWVSSKNIIYFGAHFLYRNAFGKLDYVRTLPGNYLGGNNYAQNWGLINKLRGNSDNDMIMVGERNTIMHFNGLRWSQLGMPYSPNSNYDWLSVDMKGDMIIAAGFYNMNATIMVLKRK